MRASIKVVTNIEVDTLKTWFHFFDFIIPNKMIIKADRVKIDKEYSEPEFLQVIENVIHNNKFSITYSHLVNEIRVSKSAIVHNTFILSACLDLDLYLEKKQSIDLLVDKIMEQCGVSAKVSILEDDFWQNMHQIEIYKAKGRSLKNIPLKKDPRFNNREIVNVEKMPGYNTYINGIWAGSA
ncbi:hypothetical protein [Listeria costaricensis]|uniref:hypothetical protein n=1 Tax=Listeria costaricensis TaxID=2026604 RepID=UPI000C08DACB|nr:hypothetical protein [Listeria costaricensis]